MGKTNWTHEQKKAIYTRNCNLLVAAAAGSGKTAVLVERIISMITDDEHPVDIDKLLVVTFTNAAAAEMRERIASAISQKLDEEPESIKLQRQLTLLSRAKITTIHSFCLEVIRDNFHVIDIDPSFRVADETEGILLKQESLEEILDEKYEEGNEEFLRLANCYSGRDDIKLQEIILDIHNFVNSAPWPQKWLEEAAEAFNVDDNFKFGESRWADLLVKSALIEIKGIKRNIQNAVNIIKQTDGLEHYLDIYYKDLDFVDRLCSTKSYDELKKEFDNMSFSALPRKKVLEEISNIKDKVKSIRDKAKKDLGSIQNDLFSNSEDVLNSISSMYPVIKSLSNIIIDFDNKYTEKKRERGIIDFNDIEHMCLNVLIERDESGNLVPSKAAKQYTDKFYEILIDEYQDSNLVQEEILKSISRKKDGKPINIFMVGDVKQSIYRFRQAKPELFLEKYRNYKEKEGEDERKVKLFKNFRSRKEIIDGVNFIFKHIMSYDIGELEYDDNEALNLGAEYPSLNKSENYYDIELHIIDCENAKEEVNDTYYKDSEDDYDYDEEENENLDSIQLEARLVAKRIKQLMDEEFKVYSMNLKTYRPLQYRDIVILLRTTSNWAAVFSEELANHHIPVYSDTNSGYFDTSEVRTMLSLLQVIDNPFQDIPLIGVLRSPIAAFSAEELIDVRMVNREVSFYEALKETANYDIDDKKIEALDIKDEFRETMNKALSFLRRLEVWREKSLNMATDEFIWYLYTETGYFGYAGAMPGGMQRQANLRILFERARQYENTSYKGLFNFINFINKLRNSSGDMGSAKVLGENENVVRIMSIHKSKGLEFPVVILSGTGKQFNLTDMNKSILYHQKLGYGPNYIDTDRRIYYPTLVKQIIKRKIKIETLSEEMRILYVAFTRAKEKLIITGSVKNIEKNSEKWCAGAAVSGNKISEYSILKGKNYLDWICPVISKHEAGAALRDISSEDIQNLIYDDSKWDISLWDKNKIITDSTEEEMDEVDIIKEIEIMNETTDKSKFSKEISRRLEWKYKYDESTRIPAKFSVSEIKKRFLEELMMDEDASQLTEQNAVIKLRRPCFLEDTNRISATERGTLMHLVMQHIDLDKTSSLEDVKSEIEKLRTHEFITDEQLKVIDDKKVYRFFKSALGKRVLASKNVQREVPFFIPVKSTSIFRELSEDVYRDEEVMVQGVIDCYFEEEGEIVLIDYKTDYVNVDVDEDINKIESRYKIQLEYYSMALEMITGKKVKQRYLYLFSNDNILKI